MIAAANLLTVSPAAAEPAVELTGHGYGHGRGMGQYGALGYAIDHHWNHAQILDHFYGGTAAGNIGNITMNVRFDGLEGHGTFVYQQRGRMRTSADGWASPHTAIWAQRVAPGQFDVRYGAGCGGPWSPPARVFSHQVVFTPEVKNSEDIGNMLELCLPNGTRWYRGDLFADGGGDTQHTVNWLDMESYLRGVVPRESPASWADLGGGRGINALRAQAVAARSYAASEARWPYAKTCDTISCQVYLGRAQFLNGAFSDNEDGRSTRAVFETAGQVRFRNGAVARTEFSSSTGGYSAGGTFPAVFDDGDDVSLNRNHRWVTTIPFSAIQNRYGRPGLRHIEVIRRNGIGDFGGRVLTIRLSFDNGDVFRSGDQFRFEMGLRSNWFAVTAVISAIDRHWFELGGDRSVVGSPTTPEYVAPDRVGRFRVYQRGSIYWSPASGAWEVHGAIRDKWGQLGWELGFLRYPVTDELPTPDRVGRFNHFQGGSVYWTPATWSREVHGAIRDKWAQLGWERSFLGYPVSDEYDIPGGRRSDFQGGSIEWDRANNATRVVAR